MEPKQDQEERQPPIPQKANTTSSVFIGSTISAPNMKAIVKSMSKILFTQITDDVKNEKKFPKSYALSFFNEEKYMKEKPEQFSQERVELLRQLPEQNHIYEFIYAIFMIGEFSHECCIIAMIFLFRFTRKTQFPLLPTTWRPVVFASLLVAQKVVDDICLKNADFLQIYPFWNLQECNKLEQKYLSLIEYDVNVGLQAYLQYFYELRSLCNNEELFPKQPLTSQQADILEARSKRYAAEERFKEEISQGAKSLDYQEAKSKGRVVLD